MSTNDLEDPALFASLALDERAGPAPRISRERAAAMVENALATMPLAAATPVPVARGQGLLRSLAIAAGALLMLTGGVALARFAYEQLIAKHEAVKQPTAVPAEPKAPAPAAKPAAEAIATPTAVPVSGSDSESGSDSDSDSESGSDSVSGSDRPAVRKAHDALAPDDLLQKANRLRSTGEFAEAAATYSQVYERDPHSLSAYVAEVAAASIELEHLAHPARARKLFERALRSYPAGALDLEARQGLSLSLRDLGEAGAEGDALRSLIEHHPKSPAAKRAELRLHELAGAAH
jgi:tetratricopeptide (TPR) repeat protein